MGTFGIKIPMLESEAVVAYVQPRVSCQGAYASRERRAGDSGRLGRRQSDVWLPYSAAFVTQFLAQNS